MGSCSAVLVTKLFITFEGILLTVERNLKRQKYVIKVAQLGPKAENRSDWLQTIRSIMSFRTDAEYARKELAVDLSEALIAANVPIEKVTP